MLQINSRSRIVVGVIGLLLLIGVFLFMKDNGPWADESVHIYQIQQFYNKNFTLYPYLTNIPGYHLLLAGLAVLFHNPSMQMLRGINLGFGLLAIGVFYLLQRRIQPQTSLSRLVQFIFFPLIFPFNFLVYTDILSLLLVLFSLYLALKRDYEFSGLVCTISMAVRQNNVVWLVMIPLITYLVQEDFSWNKPAIIRMIKACWTFFLGLAAIGVFFIVNRGFALGDQGAHPPGVFHTGNIFLLLMLYTLCFLPHILAHLPRFLKALQEKWYVGLVILVLLILYLVTFRNNHPYNFIKPEYFLRNYWLKFITATELMRVLFFIPVMLAALDLLTTTLARKEYYLLYGFTVLFLLPSWLIEQRYTMIPFALLLLYRPEDEPVIEWGTCLVSVFLAAFFICGVGLGKFFL